jgi:hypothetical protein
MVGKPPSLMIQAKVPHPRHCIFHDQKSDEVRVAFTQQAVAVRGEPCTKPDVYAPGGNSVPVSTVLSPSISAQRSRLSQMSLSKRYT